MRPGFFVMTYRRDEPLLGFIRAREKCDHDWEGCTRENELLERSCDDAIVCDSVDEALRVLHRRYPVPHPHNRFTGVTRLAWNKESDYAPPVIYVSNVPLGDELDDESFMTACKACGWLGLADTDDRDWARKHYPPEYGFVPCSDQWVENNLNVSLLQGMVIRYDVKAARSMCMRMANARLKPPARTDALLIDDVACLINNAYGDIMRLDVPFCDEFRCSGMDGHMDALERVLNAHEVIYGSRKYRELPSYREFVWKCYDTWPRTKRKWGGFSAFLSWIESEFRSRKAKEVIKSAKNGNPPDMSYSSRYRHVSSRLPKPRVFDFTDFVRYEEEKVDGAGKTPRLRQLRLRFPREKVVKTGD